MKRSKKNTDILSVKKLKKEQSKYTSKFEKEELMYSIHIKENYTFYIFTNYIPSKEFYEVFLSLDDSDNVIGGLLYKNFKVKFQAMLYHKYLEYFVTHKKLSSIAKKLNTI